MIDEASVALILKGLISRGPFLTSDNLMNIP